MSILLVLFWLCVAAIVYTYLLFPVIVYLRGRYFNRPYTRFIHTPKISLVMAVHNEEEDLPKKLDNILGMTYPHEKIEVVIASDGSTDRTNAILQAASSRRMQALLLERVGKAGALNAAVEKASGEILVFSDANSMYAPGAILRLVEPFADEMVGGVAGNQQYLSGRGNNLSQSGEKSYWNFDRLMKVYESRAGNVVSATGSIYAIRRRLFQPIIEGVTDDFYTSTGVIEQGFRLVFAPDAISYEPVSTDAEREFNRKVRIITRGLRGVMARRALLNPFKYGFYALQLFSHKVMRRLVVFPLLVMFAASLFLAREHLFYGLAAAGQAAFYIAAALGFLVRRSRNRLMKLASLPFYFTLVNAAAMVAFFNIVRGAKIARWEPARAGAGQSSDERTIPVTSKRRTG